MILKIASAEFVLTRVEDSERVVIVVRQSGSNAEICIDMTKKQAETLSKAIQALSR